MTVAPFRYRITLLDPMFYAREGLSASHTPKWLHATAVNGAACAATGTNVEHHPFVISDNNGGMDTPRYTSSLLSDDFYFTPATPKTTDDWVEMVKGDQEGFIFKTVAGEILKASRLHFIAPETEFVGLGLLRRKVKFPDKVRLGSFRGMARLEIEFAKTFKITKNSRLVDHAVDPLVSKVDRGFMVNMFPYPIVSNATCSDCLELKFERPKFGWKTASLAWPEAFDKPKKPKAVRSTGVAIL